MRYGRFVTIKGFGDFAMSTAEKKKRVWKEELMSRKRFLLHMKRKAEMKKRRKKHDRLDKINNSRAVIGLKPLTLDEFIHITKKRKPRKLKTYSKFNYTFEILDTLEKPK
jgi:hypothetical protein